MKDAFNEKGAIDAEEAMMKGHNPNKVAQNLLRPENGKRKEIYFYVRNQTKPSKWHVVYVQHLGPYVTHVSSTEFRSGVNRKVAYEDIRLAPRHPLLKELEKDGFLFEPYRACPPDPLGIPEEQAVLKPRHEGDSSARSSGGLLSAQKTWLKQNKNGEGQEKSHEQIPCNEM